MAPKAFGQKRQMSPRERSELFVSRRSKQQRLAWPEVDYITLITALGCCMAEGATVSFAPAQGGIGVTLRIYRGDYADTEFAGSAEELEELLALVIDGLGSSSEDPREVTRLALTSRGALAAD